MKGLTIEQKAKRYDEVTEIARKEYKKHESFKGFCEMLVHILPELKENKDEEIRKDIVAAVETYGDFTQGRKEEIYAWLEKQGEAKESSIPQHEGTQKDTSCKENDDSLTSEDERMRKAIHICLDWLDGHRDYQPKGEYSIKDMIAWLEKQDEQTWNEADENCLQELIHFFESSLDCLTIEEKHEENRRWLSWLKSIKDRVQFKSEWNEKDNKNLEYLLEILYYFYAYSGCDLRMEEYSVLKIWLKSLKPKKKWKPSEEHISVLNWCTRINPATGELFRKPSIGDITILRDLLERLKQL